MLSSDEKNSLLVLAKATLEEVVSYRAVPTPESLGITLSSSLQEPRGAFVTLYHNGSEGRSLRGCIGTIQPMQPLYQSVINNTIHAALHDSRFSPVCSEELSSLDLEINVLTRPQSVASYNDIVLGRDGIIFYSQGRQAVFLPSVPLDFGWSLPETLSELASKAGLPAAAWQEEGARFEVFQSEKF